MDSDLTHLPTTSRKRTELGRQRESTVAPACLHTAAPEHHPCSKAEMQLAWVRETESEDCFGSLFYSHKKGAQLDGGGARL